MINICINFTQIIIIIFSVVCESEAIIIYRHKTENNNEMLEEILAKTINTIIMKIDI